ncbi:MAG: glycerophosphodiester phosphodiesterase [Burkholderiales bacterium]
MPTSSAPWPYPLWFAHRGGGNHAPENTLTAFRCGARHGFEAYECDVKVSADDQPFLLHDTTLERTTSGRGVAGNLPWVALAALDAGRWYGPAHAGEPLPRLAEVAGHCLQTGHALNLEIKPTPGTEARTGQLVALAAQQLWAGAVAAGRSPWPLLSSFDVPALMAAQAAAPALPRALLLDTQWPGWADTATALGCVAVVLNHTLVDAALLRTEHGHGRRVLVYTVNEAARADTLIAWGIDGLITDAIDRLGPGAAAASA